jgi:hypothetical protein
MNITGSIKDINITPGSSHTAEIWVTNTAASAKTYKVRRTILSMDAGDLTQFCWGGLCYGYTTNTSSLTVTVNPGDTIDFVENGFHALFSAGSANVTRTVHYQFYDMADNADSSGVTMRYNSVVGVSENSRVASISNAFPNPASAAVSLKYDLNGQSGKARIVMYDMLGKKVKDTELTDRAGTARISVAELNAGVYFYTLMVEDKAITTKKLVISSK